ncbi:MAG: gamma-glutamyltransferase [Xanthomonadales bacterium]|nr:Glutathione hydrolase proenzyme [Xanthomonadales bacterium]MCC6592828.1 gamma-glutamyltransferase [Xanthomonadales bacterium]MCE7931557.1 gamma-glutamyltransferase [Xanthomonadales bacterium PRO6]
MNAPRFASDLGWRAGLFAWLLLSAPTLCLAERPAAAAIASANWQATAAGFDTLARGGNAFDAAVAVSAALSVVEPESSGLGGGGFFLLHRAADGKAVFVDAREKAPAAASRDMYLDAAGRPQRERSTNGPLAAAVPGLPAGLALLAERYGRLPLKDSLAPAIRLARKGWTWSDKNAAMIAFRAPQLQHSPAARALFLRAGKPPKPGQRMRNRDIAAVLERLAEEGHAGFYQGRTAELLVDGVRAAGGIFTLEDLAGYRAVERAPLRFDYRGQTILTAPPPSSGGVALVGLFQILAGYPLDRWQRVPRLHVAIEAMRRVYRDRAIYLGDPDFVQMPMDMLLSPHYAAGLRASIDTTRATPSDTLPGIGAGPEGRDTSHFSIIDAEGNVAAVTQSVNLPFGAAFVAPGTGFVLNNEMDDFSVKPGVPNAFGLIGEDANAIAPGKRPLSSMSPTILLGSERVAAIGTPGGSRIITMVFQGLSLLLDGKSAAEAVAAPRIHHQYQPDSVSIEPGALNAEESAALAARGHTIATADQTWGNMQIVLWNLATGAVEAASDPRWKTVGGSEVRAQDAVYR